MKCAAGSFLPDGMGLRAGGSQIPRPTGGIAYSCGRGIAPCAAGASLPGRAEASLRVRLGQRAETGCVQVCKQ